MKVLNWVRRQLKKRNSKHIMQEQGRRFLKKAENDIKHGNIEHAISRFEGYFNFNAEDQVMHERVAKLYITIKDHTRAGKHLYFKEFPTEFENQCIDIFKKSVGNSPTLILRKLIHQSGFRIKEMNSYTKLKVKALINDSIQESGCVPNFLKGLKIYFDKTP